jgi:FMN phosphatase YigB (HAD superfamily)
LRRSVKRERTDGKGDLEGYRLVTLDVFDTCLSRDFIAQESLWRLVGRYLAEAVPGMPGEREFVRLRGEAEDHVRQLSPRDDISLPDVYSRLAELLHWDAADTERAMGVEEELEARGLHVNPAIGPILASLPDLPLCYLTDTPHRGTFIARCLADNGLPDAPVLSSGDLGLLKGRGALFGEAVTRFGVLPTEILHIGNDFTSDGVGSSAARVSFRPVLDANPTRYETTLDASAHRADTLVGPVLAGASRAFRLREEVPAPAALRSVAAGVAGPAILASAAWTLLRAEADGVDTVYYVSRDGEILLAAANVLRRELGLAPGVECRYLFGSRQAWHLPALALKRGAGFAAALRAQLERPGPLNLAEMLAKLDLDAAEQQAIQAEVAPDLSLDAPLGERRDQLVNALVSSEDFRALVHTRAVAALERTTGYLRQEQMIGGAHRSALVDVGWLGHATRSLVAIAADQGAEVLPYFTGGLAGHGSEFAPENSRAFLIEARGEEPAIQQPLVHLLESFCAGHGHSAIGYAEYDGRYIPAFANNEADVMTAHWDLDTYQQLVLGYVEIAAQALKRNGMTLTLADLGAIRPALIKNVVALWRSPTYGEAQVWGSCPFLYDASSSGVLGRAVKPRELLSYLAAARKPDERPRFGPWRQATIALTLGNRWLSDPLGLPQLLVPERRHAELARLRMLMGPMGPIRAR